MADLTTDQQLDLIRKHESGGRNVPNYMFDPKHTAQGYYQITNTNWKAYAPKVGIDIEKYPTAMSASEDDQKKVATHLLTQTSSGINNWADFNPQLKAALGQKDSKMAEQEQEEPTIGGFTRAQLQAELQRRLKERSMSQRSAIDEPRGILGSMFGAVTDPIKKWATTPEEPTAMGKVRDVLGAVPGAKQMTRGFLGAGQPEGGGLRSQASDVIEGFGRVATVPSIIAGAATAGPELLAGRGLMSAYKAASPLIKGYAGSRLGGTVAEHGSELFTEDPETRRLAGNIGGLVGSGAAGIPDESIGKFVSSPKTQAAALALGGTALGHPYLGGAAALARLGIRPGGRLGLAYDMFKGGGESPKGTVKSPEYKPPTRAESTEMLRLGQIDEQRFMEHEADRNSDPKTAQEHLDTARSKIAEDRLKELEKQKSKQPVAQAQIKPVPETTPSATPTGGTPTGPRVVVPPGAQIELPGPQGPVGPPPVNTQLSPPLQPTPPPAPGSLGTVGPLGPQPPNPPLQGPAAQGTPPGTQLTPPPAPPTATPNLGTVGKLGQMPPSGPLAGAAAQRTPLGTMPPTPLEVKAMKIADVATKIGKAPPKTAANVTSFARWLRELGFKPTPEELARAREIYAEREIAKKPRP